MKPSALVQAAFVVGLTSLAVLFALLYVKAAIGFGELLRLALLPAF